VIVVVVALNTGVVIELLPVTVGVPPVAVVYQSVVTPETAVAVSVAVLPVQIVAGVGTVGKAGRGYTVMVNVLASPPVGVTVKVATKLVVPVLTAVKEGILPDPLFASPMAAPFVAVQLHCAGTMFVPVKVTAVVWSPGHTVWLEGWVSMGMVMFTLATLGETTLTQGWLVPDRVMSIYVPSTAVFEEVTVKLALLDPLGIVTLLGRVLKEAVVPV
jgi:hypothetical protein